MQDLTISQLLYIKENLICGARFDDKHLDGDCYWYLCLYRGQRGNVELLVTYCVTLAMSDSIAQEEIVDLDKNPELFDIYDWAVGNFIEDKVYDCLEHIKITELVTDFDETSPATAIHSN